MDIVIPTPTMNRSIIWIPIIPMDCKRGIISIFFPLLKRLAVTLFLSIITRARWRENNNLKFPIISDHSIEDELGEGKEEIGK